MGDSEGCVAGASSDGGAVPSRVRSFFGCGSPLGAGAVLSDGAGMPISVRLRWGSGAAPAFGTGIPINVRLRLSSGISGAFGRVEAGGGDAEAGLGPGSER